jgi:hypothetical protein
VVRRRLAVTCLAALCWLAFGAACTKPSPSGSPSVDVLAELKAAAAKTDGQPFSFTIAAGSGLNGTGSQDGTAKNLTLDLDLAEPSSGLKIKAQLLIISPDVFLKLDLGGLNNAVPGLASIGDKWMHIDTSKFAGGTAFGISPGKDMLSPGALLAGATSATKKSPSDYAGTMDTATLSLPFVSGGTGAAGAGASPSTSASASASAGTGGAATIPFTATVDSSGRIAAIGLLPPQSGGGSEPVTVSYKNYGTAVPVTKPPAASIVEAPDVIYQFLR